MDHLHRWFLAALWVQLLSVAALAQFGVDPTIENAKKVGSIIDRTGMPLGSCFYVDRRGYVATAFSNVERSADAMVVFNSGDRFPVIGLANASRGKDIAILALKGMPDQVPPLSLLRAGAAPVIGDHLMRWGGPIAEKANVPVLSRVGVLNAAAIRPADSTAILPKLARKLRGDEYLLGATDLPEWTIGRDPNIEWLWLDQPRHRSCAGGPVFDRAGDVVAMVSGSLDKKLEIIAAVHVQHIVDLLPEDPVKLKPLSELRNWIDPIPMAEALPELDEESSSLGGRINRGHPLAARFADLQRRVTKAEQEEAEIAKTHAKTLARSLELAPQIEKIVKDLQAIVPEESYQTTETRTRTVRKKVKKSKSGKDKDKDEYEDVEEEYEVKVTRRRYSARQLAAIEPIQKDVDTKRAEIAGNAVTLSFLSEQQDRFVKQLRRRLAEELFYLADPLGLRSREEHEAFVEALSATIDEGGAPAIVYLLRAMSRATLDDFENARADLAEAADADAKFKFLTEAIDARCKIRAGDTAEGNKQMNRALSQSKNDPRVLMLAARGALDRGDHTAAARYLNLAVPTCPDETELRLGLAWVYVSSPGAGASRVALEHAEAAVRLTAGHDWSALGALAAAHARRKDFAKALAGSEAAVRVAPAEAAEQCRTWQAQLAVKQPIQRLWK